MHKGLSQGLLPFIVVDSLGVELSKTPGLHHASFAEDIEVLTPSSDKFAIQVTAQSTL